MHDNVIVILIASINPCLLTETRQEVSLQKDNAQHLIGQHAREAHEAIHELSVELIGEKSLEEASERVKEVPFAPESVNYTTRYLMPLYKWLLGLLHSAFLSVTDDSKFHDTLKVIVSDHWPETKTFSWR